MRQRILLALDNRSTFGQSLAAHKDQKIPNSSGEVMLDCVMRTSLACNLVIKIFVGRVLSAMSASVRLQGQIACIAYLLFGAPCGNVRAKLSVIFKDRPLLI